MAETTGTATAKTELDKELEKVGATLAKIGNGVLNFIEKEGEAVAATLAPALENVLTNVATALIGKTLAKYGIKA